MPANKWRNWTRNERTAIAYYVRAYASTCRPTERPFIHCLQSIVSGRRTTADDAPRNGLKPSVSIGLWWQDDATPPQLPCQCVVVATRDLVCRIARSLLLITYMWVLSLDIIDVLVCTCVYVCACEWVCGMWPLCTFAMLSVAIYRYKKYTNRKARLNCE